jgi:hypothetical protein
MSVVVNALIPFNSHLRVVDMTVLNPVIIAKAYAAHLRWSGPGKDSLFGTYLCRLAASMSCVPPSWTVIGDDHEVVQVPRSHLPDDVTTENVRFRYRDATCPLNLSHFSLTNATLMSLDLFEHVTVLNLSYNKLTTLTGTGISRMTSLQRLDLQYNQLE